jgi:hypothetical protein
MDRSSRLFFFPENEPDKLNVQDSRKAIEAGERAVLIKSNSVLSDRSSGRDKGYSGISIIT